MFWFEEGGNQLQAMVSHGDMLAVFKNTALYGVFGNSFANFYSKYLSGHGTKARRSPVSVPGKLFYWAIDGIRMWDGSKDLSVSKHIQTDIDTYSTVDIASTLYKGYAYMASPGNNACLLFDPDTFRYNDMGDGRVSFFKYSNYRVDQFLYEDGAGDHGYLLGISNSASTTAAMIVKLDNDTFDNLGTTATVSARLQTKYYSFGDDGAVKRYTRFKPIIAEVASVTSAAHTLTIYADSGKKSAVATLTIAKGTGYWATDMGFPYTVDGRNLSFDIRHAQLLGTRLVGYSLGFEKRYY